MTPEERRAKNTADKRRARAANRAHHNALARAWNAKNPEKKRASDRASYLRRRERILAQKKEYFIRNAAILAIKSHANYLATIEERKAYDHAYNIAHRPEKKVKNRKYRVENKAELLLKERAYRLAHPEVGIAHGVRRRARKRTLPLAFSTAEQAFCRAYFHYACAVCGNENGFKWTIGMDHWIPLNSPDCPGTIATNMIPLCHGMTGCNNSKSDHDPETWLLARFGPRKARQILARIRAYFAIVAERQAHSS